MSRCNIHGLQKPTLPTLILPIGFSSLFFFLPSLFSSLMKYFIMTVFPACSFLFYYFQPLLSICTTFHQSPLLQSTFCYDDISLSVQQPSAYLKRLLSHKHLCSQRWLLTLRLLNYPRLRFPPLAALCVCVCFELCRSSHSVSVAGLIASSRHYSCTKTLFRYRPEANINTCKVCVSATEGCTNAKTYTTYCRVHTADSLPYKQQQQPSTGPPREPQSGLPPSQRFHLGRWHNCVCVCVLQGLLLAPAAECLCFVLPVLAHAANFTSLQRLMPTHTLPVNMCWIKPDLPTEQPLTV